MLHACVDMKEKIKIKNIIMYVISAGLLVFYLFVLYKGMNHDNVTPTYRLFYFEEKLKYYVPYEEFKEYTVNTETILNPDGNFKNIGKRWHAPEDDGSFCYSAQSDLFYYLDEVDNCNYKLTMEVSKDNGFENAFLVNGKKIGSIVIKNGIIELEIPPEMLTEGINTFTIKRVQMGEDEKEDNFKVRKIAFSK